MDTPLYSKVVLLHDVPEEGLRAGDVGTVVEFHHVEGLEQGCSVEFFDMTGNTVGIATLPISHFRQPTRTDRPTIRIMDSVA